MGTEADGSVHFWELAPHLAICTQKLYRSRDHIECSDHQSIAPQPSDPASRELKAFSSAKSQIVPDLRSLEKARRTLPCVLSSCTDLVTTSSVPTTRASHPSLLILKIQMQRDKFCRG
jgi:hypothetical protein